MMAGKNTVWIFSLQERYHTARRRENLLKYPAGSLYSAAFPLRTRRMCSAMRACPSALG